LDSFSDSFREHHELAAAAAQRLDIMWHPRDRLTWSHLHVAVLVKPVIGAVQQLPVHNSSSAVLL